MSNASKILVALVSGIAAGAVVGLLFAPDKGSETRKKISDTAEDIINRVKTQARKMSSATKQGVDKEEQEVYS